MGVLGEGRERVKAQERVAEGGESALDGDGEDGERSHRFFTLSSRSEFIYTDLATQAKNFKIGKISKTCLTFSLITRNRFKNKK